MPLPGDHFQCAAGRAAVKRFVRDARERTDARAVPAVRGLAAGAPRHRHRNAML
jgi:hypothetical protein